jgi:hypothetical protein
MAKLFLPHEEEQKHWQRDGLTVEAIDSMIIHLEESSDYATLDEE